MPTYAENAAARERAERKRVSDREMAVRHAGFDLSAGDIHLKYERPSFTVVTASVAFREGYDQIRWSNEPQTVDLESADKSGPAGELPARGCSGRDDQLEVCPG